MPSTNVTVQAARQRVAVDSVRPARVNVEEPDAQVSVATVKERDVPTIMAQAAEEQGVVAAPVPISAKSMGPHAMLVTVM